MTNLSAAALNSMKKSAYLADAEICHLEMILSGYCRFEAISAFPAMNLEYWKARVSAITRNFELLPAQQTRVDLLSELLAKADDHLDHQAAGTRSPNVWQAA